MGAPPLAFASEGRALVEAGFAARRTDPSADRAFLWNGFMSGPQTIWTEVDEVPRGCYAVIDEQHAEPAFERFWNIGFQPGHGADRFRRSGPPHRRDGRDCTSSPMCRRSCFCPVASISRRSPQPRRLSSSDLHTLSVAFDRCRRRRASFRRRRRRAIGSQHHVVELSAAGILDDLEVAVAALDQPSFDGINSWFVSREAVRLGFKVALSGAGGDELAGGYTSFRRALQAEHGEDAGSIRPDGSRGHALEQLRPGSKAGQLGRGFGALEHMYQTQYALFSTGTLTASARRPGRA